MDEKSIDVILHGYMYVCIVEYRHIIQEHAQRKRERETCVPEVERTTWSVLSHAGNPGGGSLEGSENPGGIKL